MTLAEQILAALGESPLPVRTPDLVALVATGLSHDRSRVWTELRKLKRGGLVCSELSAVAPDGRRGVTRNVMCWRLTRRKAVGTQPSHPVAYYAAALAALGGRGTVADVAKFVGCHTHTAWNRLRAGCAAYKVFTGQAHSYFAYDRETKLWALLPAGVELAGTVVDDEPNMRVKCSHCGGPVFNDEPRVPYGDSGGWLCPDCVRKRERRAEDKRDIRCKCYVCRGPVYMDEPPGERCPDCVARLQKATAARPKSHKAQPKPPRNCFPRLRVGDGEPDAPEWREGDIDRAETPETPVLYGLLTAADVAVLEARRERYRRFRAEPRIGRAS